MKQNDPTAKFRLLIPEKSYKNNNPENPVTVHNSYHWITE